MLADRSNSCNFFKTMRYNQLTYLYFYVKLCITQYYLITIDNIIIKLTGCYNSILKKKIIYPTTGSESICMHIYMHVYLSIYILKVQHPLTHIQVDQSKTTEIDRTST